jgi:hypothetical protein
MVRAILDGKKTQTRRVIKPQPNLKDRNSFSSEQMTEAWQAGFVEVPSPYNRQGRLWVRETWLELIPDHVFNGKKYVYRADIRKDMGDSERCRKELHYHWKPSIFMPREACRMVLEIQEVRVQRLQEISEEDAIAEGVDCVSEDDVRRQATWSRRQDFAGLWDRLNKKRGYGWDRDPFVWAIEFKPLS